MTNKGKHTPGPWRVTERNAVGERYIDADGKRIGSIWPMDTHNAETTANACLVAAAPALLKAAKLTVLCFKRLEVDGNFLGDDEHEAWTALNKAIAKAEGRDDG